ncbi:MAG: hypothetical protein M3237_00945 [Actinomycetota bacterium]|nr:hypothetical protein [Actinomycetota bacterium]
MPTLHRLLATLLLAGACVLAAPGAGAASPAPCTCAEESPGAGTTVQDHVKAANAVFQGTVQEVTVLGGNAENGFSRTSTVTVSRVYKPRNYELITTDTVDVMTSATFGDCTRELRQGGTYMFFVESNEGFAATGCGGTSVATAKLTTQVQRLLGAGRPAVPPEPPTATFSPVNTDEPATLTRVAAPGLALVLIGLLGLAVVRRMGRARL